MIRPNITLFTFEHACSDIVNEIKTRGIRLNYLNICKNIIPLNLASHLSLIIISEDQLDTYFDDIQKIRSQADLSILFVINPIQNKTLNCAFIPISNEADMYWIIHSLVASIASNSYEGDDVQNMIGVDISDIGYVLGDAETIRAIVIKDIDFLKLQIAKSAIIVVISSVPADIELLEKIDSLIDGDITTIKSFIEDKRIDAGETRIVVIYSEN